MKEKDIAVFNENLDFVKKAFENDFNEIELPATLSAAELFKKLGSEEVAAPKTPQLRVYYRKMLAAAASLVLVTGVSVYYAANHGVFSTNSAAEAQKAAEFMLAETNSETFAAAAGRSFDTAIFDAAGTLSPEAALIEVTGNLTGETHTGSNEPNGGPDSGTEIGRAHV